MRKVRIEWPGRCLCHVEKCSFEIVRHHFEVADDGRVVAYCRCYEVPVEYEYSEESYE